MKWILTLFLVTVIPQNTFANGGSAASGSDKTIRGTADVDEAYLEQLKKDRALRESYDKNPRNRSFSESFERADSKESQEERRPRLEDEELKNDAPYFDSYQKDVRD
jgi:hypothetical protein